MNTSKAISIAAVAACLLYQMPASADGNAYKYPPVVPPVPAIAKPAAVVNATPTEAATAKPAEAANVKSTDVGSSQSAESAVTLTRLTGPFSNIVMVSRYEPLSSRDTIEVVPDFNRGHGSGK